MKFSGSSSRILLVGDFNSRTGDKLEYEKPDDMDENYIPREQIPAKRKNCGQYTNMMGTKLVDLCKSGAELHFYMDA